jgi:hypothetical protein
MLKRKLRLGCVSFTTTVFGSDAVTDATGSKVALMRAGALALALL